MSEAVLPVEPEPIEQDKMDQLVNLSTRAQQLEAELAQLDEQMSEKSKELQTILGGYQKPGTLVELLQSTGVSDITLTNGVRVVIDEDLKAPSMAAGSKYREITVDWLKKRGHGDVVKNELTVNVPKGKEELAEEVQKFAAEVHGLTCKRFETVNAQTLAALLRELLEAGQDVPLEQIGAYMFRKAEIIQTK